jgi:hypothetical protein
MISIADRREFQARATTGMYMSHRGLGSDLSLLDQKIKPDLCPYASWLARLNKQTA